MCAGQIINQEAFELGKIITGADRTLIQDKLNLSESAVNIVLSGKRKALRGKSLEVIEMAKKIAQINRAKAELL